MRRGGRDDCGAVRARGEEVPAIFVKGRIANVKALGNGMWRVGLEFLR